MTIAVKICGLNSAAAADAAVRAGAAFGGLVFFAKSPRLLTIEAASPLAARMRGRLKLAALVVDADDALLERIAADVKPDFFQLHGQESVARAAAIKARFGIPLIKAFPIAEPSDVARVAAYDDVAEMFLFDTPPAAGATRPGGHGTAFDWRMLAGRRFNRPWFLAGGLNPGNVARAIAVSGAQMVDVSSGVESAPGVKSESLIGDFVAAARASAAMQAGPGDLIAEEGRA
jgi:phosphoribosylanthranilate isomerase